MLKVVLRDPRRTVAEDWPVPLKMMPKVRGHWPCALPPRKCASYIEDHARNSIFRAGSQCQGSPFGGNEVSSPVLLASAYASKIREFSIPSPI